MKWSNNLYTLEDNTFVATKTSKYRDIKYELSKDLKEVMDGIYNGIYIEQHNGRNPTLFIPETHPFFNTDILNNDLIFIENSLHMNRLRMKLKDARRTTLDYARRLLWVF